MISGLPISTLDVTGIRLDPVLRLEDSLRMLTSSDQDLAELQSLVASMPDPFASIADRRFVAIAGKYRTGRYNNERFPAFYLAQDEPTSMSEVLFYQRDEDDKLKAGGNPGLTVPRFFEFTQWEVRGVGADIVPMRLSEPRLTADGWDYCQGLGQDARSRGIDVLSVPSARHPSGSNWPVFVRSAVRSLSPTRRQVEVSRDASGTLSIKPA